MAEIHNPGPFRISPAIKMAFGAFLAIGVVCFLVGLKYDPSRVWPSFLVNYFFFLALSLAGGFFTAIQHITNASWSVTVRRVAEALMSYLPYAIILGVVLLFGLHNLYEWTHHHVVEHDKILSQKAGYLNEKFFAIRLFSFLGLCTLIGFKMRKNSLDQDKSGEDRFTLSNIKLACAFIPIFGLSFTLLSFDLLMSLQPHWFSTIFGVYCFSGLFVSGLSLMAVIILSGKKQGLFTDDLVNANHMHDIGKLMFAFTVFWAYIMFSQLMLQWYANLPEEITYYLARFHGGWWNVAIALLILHFVAPFLLLLPREAKRCPKFLPKMAWLILFAQWLDVYMMVMPVFFKEGPVIGYIEVGILLGFVGLFGITVGRFLEKVPAIPIRDPRLSQCFSHTQ